MFFGRLDYADGLGSFHIGRRHVSDEHGEPMVIDWRAPVSLPFYRATRADAMSVELRRRFGFQHGTLTSFEDEDLTLGTRPGDSDYSAILEQEIERPRVGPMRDIVATIQPEQDVIVRSDLSQSICVQGAPGTGKTAVGLHRAAYLLFAHREQLTRQGVMVVGPNASFLRYIRDVLPALGEVDATQSTIAELADRSLREVNAKWSIRGDEPASVATLKGDARLAEVLSRALWSHVTMPVDGLVVPRGARRWRVATYEVEEVVTSLRNRGVRYGAARAMVPQALAHRILVRMELAGDSPDDRVQNAVARSKPVKDYATALWPAVDPARLVWRLLSDAEFLASAAEGLLSEDEQALLSWTRPAEEPGVDTLDPGGGDPGRRGCRPDRANRLGRAHRGRRGARPVPHDAAGSGPPFLDRVADRARRPRPGHHALGDPLVGRGPRPPRQARCPRRAADPRLPGARRGHRVRRPPAARDRARPRAADVRPSLARRARGGPTHLGRGRRLDRQRPGRVDRADRPGRSRRRRCP